MIDQEVAALHDGRVFPRLEGRLRRVCGAVGGVSVGRHGEVDVLLLLEAVHWEFLGN